MASADLQAREPESLLALDPDAVGAAFADVPLPLPIFDHEGIAAALIDAAGLVRAQTGAFASLSARFEIEPDLLRSASRGPRSRIQMIEMDGGGHPGSAAPIAVARAADTGGWLLPPSIRAAAATRPGDMVVVVGSIDLASATMGNACRAFGLTPAQTRVTLEIISRGNAPAAARALDLSLDTVRETLSAAKARVGVDRLPSLVLKLASHGFGVLPSGADTAALMDIWGLTERQSAIASLIAAGLARREVGRALAISEAVVKKDLDETYQILQVSTAAALSRRLVEARSMAWLMRATSGDVGFLDPVAEPLRFVPRPDGSRIAISDYGPRTGRPVLVSHTSLTTRPVGRRLLRHLHAGGYRPIAIDRPGFGLTESPQGQGDHYRQAALDTVRVLDELRIPKADLVARSGARYALAVHDEAADRLGRVVLVNPGLTMQADRRASGFWGHLKSAYRRNPRIIALWVTHLSRRIDGERHRALMRRWLAGSAADEAAVEDPGIAHDYFLAQRMFATGRVSGYVAEQTAYVRSEPLRPRPEAKGWRILVGAQDTLHDAEDVVAHWRQVLPQGEIQVAPQAGRLLALSHPELVVAALQSESRAAT